LGSEQSGFINDVGYEMYHKILDEAVQELKATDFKDLFSNELDPNNFKLPDCEISTDLQVLIPELYVSSLSERLSLYNQLDNLKNENELEDFRKSLLDRFGKFPFEVANLMELVKVRWIAESLGFEKLILKNNILKATFVSSDRTDFYQSDKFGKVLDYVNKNPRTCKLKDIKNKLHLSIEPIKDLSFLLNTLSKMGE
jgi:transcription-repair coupling factor (superfamily II helicase)